jgi:hypothetical protein
VGGQAGVNAKLMALHCLVTQVCREVHEIKACDRTWMQRTLGVVNTNMRRLAVTASLGGRVLYSKGWVGTARGTAMMRPKLRSQVYKAWSDQQMQV